MDGQPANDDEVEVIMDLGNVDEISRHPEKNDVISKLLETKKLEIKKLKAFNEELKETSKELQRALYLERERLGEIQALVGKFSKSLLTADNENTALKEKLKKKKWKIRHLENQIEAMELAAAVAPSRRIVSRSAGHVETGEGADIVEVDMEPVEEVVNVGDHTTTQKERSKQLQRAPCHIMTVQCWVKKGKSGHKRRHLVEKNETIM